MDREYNAWLRRIACAAHTTDETEFNALLHDASDLAEATDRYQDREEDQR